MKLRTLLGLTLVTLSFSTLAKLPDPLWSPMGGNPQQQFGSPFRHALPGHDHPENRAKHDATHGPDSHHSTAHTTVLPFGGA